MTVDNDKLKNNVPNDIIMLSKLVIIVKYLQQIIVRKKRDEHHQRPRL
jgi:hypothetical protein